MERALVPGVLTLLLIFSGVALASAADPAKNEKAKAGNAPAASTKTAGLTVAVLDFTASDPANPELGSELASALTAMLSGERGITLVERQSLMQTLREHELNMTGLVTDDQAIKVGKLVGAKIIVTGRSFRLGKDLFITAKLIGTETSLVEGVLVKDESPAKLGELVVQLSDKVAAKLRQVGPKLVAPEDAADPLPALKKKLANRRKPVVAVVVREQHHQGPQVVAWEVIDPAVETEIKKTLIECGFTVQDVPQNVLTDLHEEWKVAARDQDWRTNLARRWRLKEDSMAKVEVLISGEAFSEFAARIGNIVSCSARAEINVIDRDTGKTTLADRVTSRAADLSENIAGKKALQGSGRVIAIHILERFAETLPAEKK